MTQDAETIELWEDGGGVVSLTDGHRTWVFVGPPPSGGGSFAADAAALAGDDDDWLDTLGDVHHPDRRRRPQGTLIATWTRSGGVRVVGDPEAAARQWLGIADDR